MLILLRVSEIKMIIKHKMKQCLFIVFSKKPESKNIVKHSGMIRGESYTELYFISNPDFTERWRAV